MSGGREIEWVEAGRSTAATPPDVIAPRGHGGRHDPRDPHWFRYRWWYAAAALIVLVAILVATRPSHTAPRAESSPSPSLTRPAPPTPVQSAAPVGPPGLIGAGQPSSSTVGHSLVDVPASWVLFGRGSESVTSIQLASGQFTTTPIPLLSSNGPASFLAGPDRVVIRPLDLGAGYDVRDGQPVEQRPRGFPNEGPALAGPDPQHMWVPGKTSQTMALVGIDGTPTTTTITLPGAVDTGSVSSDGAGYLQAGTVGGYYDLRPSGVTRITTGALLGIGPTTWITEECDAQARCVTTVINSQTGARHTLSLPPADFESGSYVSPDGTTAAVFEGDQTQPVRLHLINLTTGADHATDVTTDPNLDYQAGLFAWSPDNNWVFATNGTGRLYAVNARTDATTTLDLTLGPISQLALRAPTG